MRRSLTKFWHVAFTGVNRHNPLLRTFSSKFNLPENKNDLSSLQAVKQEAKNKLKAEKEAIQQNVLTVDQMTQRIIEVKTIEDLRDKVAEHNKPVVVFCMAKWCNSCKQLLPTILQAFSVNHEHWDLALLDIDDDAKLTSALKIDKTPTVLLVAYGEIVDGFKGLVAESEVEKFFLRANKIGVSYASAQNVQRTVQELLKDVEEQNWDSVLEKARKIKSFPLQPPIKRLIGLFEINAMVKAGQVAEAHNLFTQLTEAPMPEADEQLIASIEQMQQNLSALFENVDKEQEGIKVDFQALMDKATSDPDQLFAVAKTSLEAEVFDVALESLLRIVKKNRSWNEKAAYNLFLEILKNPKVPKVTVKEYRLKLGSLIA